MAARRVSQLVRGADFIAQMMRELTIAVRELGGTDADIYKLGQPLGRQLLYHLALECCSSSPQFEEVAVTPARTMQVLSNYVNLHVDPYLEPRMKQTCVSHDEATSLIKLGLLDLVGRHGWPVWTWQLWNQTALLQKFTAWNLRSATIDELVHWFEYQARHKESALAGADIAVIFSEQDSQLWECDGLALRRDGKSITPFHFGTWWPSYKFNLLVAPY